MILCFTKNSQIPTDTQHIEHLRPFMRVQEEEPLSPQRSFKVTAKWSSEKPAKRSSTLVGLGPTRVLLYIPVVDWTA